VNALECTLMPLSEYWIQMNMIVCAWKRLSAHEHLRANIESYWMRLMHLGALECLWVSIEATWVRTSSWPNLKGNQKGWFKTNLWMKVGVNKRSLTIHNKSGSMRYLIVTWQSTSVCILAIVWEKIEYNSLIPYVWLEDIGIAKIWCI